MEHNKSLAVGLNLSDGKIENLMARRSFAVGLNVSDGKIEDLMARSVHEQHPVKAHSQRVAIVHELVHFVRLGAPDVWQVHDHELRALGAGVDDMVQLVERFHASRLFAVDPNGRGCHVSRSHKRIKDGSVSRALFVFTRLSVSGDLTGQIAGGFGECH